MNPKILNFIFCRIALPCHGLTPWTKTHYFTSVSWPPCPCHDHEPPSTKNPATAMTNQTSKQRPQLEPLGLPRRTATTMFIYCCQPLLRLHRHLTFILPGKPHYQPEQPWCTSFIPRETTAYCHCISPCQCRSSVIASLPSPPAPRVKRNWTESWDWICWGKRVPWRKNGSETWRHHSQHLS